MLPPTSNTNHGYLGIKVGGPEPLLNMAVVIISANASEELRMPEITTVSTDIFILFLFLPARQQKVGLSG